MIAPHLLQPDKEQQCKNSSNNNNNDEEEEEEEFPIATLDPAIFRIRKDLQSNLEPPAESMYLGPNNGEKTKHLITTWKGNESEKREITSMAVNLAHATSIQRLLIEDVFGKKLNYKNKADMAVDPSVELTKQLAGKDFNPTKIAFNVLNIPTAIGRHFNIDHFYQSAENLQEMNEKMLNLPYYISYIQIILKVILTVLIFTVLIGQFRLVSVWASCWFLSLSVPCLLVLSRIITNLILIHTLRLDEKAKILSDDSIYII